LTHGQIAKTQTLAYEQRASFSEWKNNTRWESNRDVEPNTLSYNSAINAWANTQDPNAGMHVEPLLRRMEELSEMGNLEVKPDTTTYNTANTAWANSRDAKEGAWAEALLKLIEGQYKMGCMGKQPRPKCWNARGGHPSASGRTIQDGKRRSQA
jgi:hypothetical protein